MDFTDLFGGDGSDSAGFMTDPATSSTDVSLPLNNNWQQPYSDTFLGDTTTASDGFDMLGNNMPGNNSMAVALRNDIGSTTATPGGPSGFLQSIDKAFTDSFNAMTTGVISAGTVAAKAKIGTAIGGSNPGPTNSNTNLANKSLLQRATALQQNLLGGILATKNGGTNWWMLGGIGILIVIIFMKLVRR